MTDNTENKVPDGYATVRVRNALKTRLEDLQDDIRRRTGEKIALSDLIEQAMDAWEGKDSAMPVPADKAPLVRALIEFMSRAPKSETERRLQMVMPGLLGLETFIPQVIEGKRIDNSVLDDTKSKHRKAK